MSFRETLKGLFYLTAIYRQKCSRAVCHTSEGKDTNGLLVSLAMGFLLGTYSSFRKVNYMEDVFEHL